MSGFGIFLLCFTLSFSLQLAAQNGGGGNGGGSGGAQQQPTQQNQTAKPANPNAETVSTDTEQRSPLLAVDPFGWLTGPLDRNIPDWKKNDHFSLSGSYTFLNQYATVTNAAPKPGLSGYDRHDQLSGRLDLSMAYVFAHQQKDESSINLLVRSGTNIGTSQQFNLSNNLGSELGVNSIQGGTPNAQTPIMVNLLYYQQTWWSKNINFYIGKLHPNQHVDLSTVADDETKQFIGGPFDGNASNPRNGIWSAPGAALEIDTPSHWYTHGIFVNADGQQDTGPRSVMDGRYFESAEVGWRNQIAGREGKDFRAFAWHNDSKTGSGWGGGMGEDYEFPNHWVVFTRAGIGDRQATPIKQMLSIGTAQTRPWDRHSDMFGASGTWTIPSQAGQPHEILVETFYRLRIFRDTEIGPDVQALHHPMLNPKIGDTVLLGVRGRIIF